MFNKKLKRRIEDLEIELRDARDNAEKCASSRATISKFAETLSQDITKKDMKIKQLTADLDILKNEREEIREKCENAVDKDALLKLYMMKNHDLEMQINDLKSRLSYVLNLNSSMLLNQSIYNNTRTALMMQQCRIF